MNTIRRQALLVLIGLGALWTLFFLACSEAYAGQTRLPPEYRARYESVERCLGVDVKQPRIEFQRTVPCPMSGLMRCMADYPFFSCSAGLCGANGAFYPAAEPYIALADQYVVSMEHEGVHHILYMLGDPNYRNHAHPAFAACGFPQP